MVAPHTKRGLGWSTGETSTAPALVFPHTPSSTCTATLHANRQPSWRQQLRVRVHVERISSAYLSLGSSLQEDAAAASSRPYPSFSVAKSHFRPQTPPRAWNNDWEPSILIERLRAFSFSYTPPIPTPETAKDAWTSWNDCWASPHSRLLSPADRALVHKSSRNECSSPQPLGIFKNLVYARGCSALSLRCSRRKSYLSEPSESGQN